MAERSLADTTPETEKSACTQTHSDILYHIHVRISYTLYGQKYVEGPVQFWPGAAFTFTVDLVNELASWDFLNIILLQRKQ